MHTDSRIPSDRSGFRLLMSFEHQRYCRECALQMSAWERRTRLSQSLLTQLRVKLIDLATSGSSSDGRNHRISRRPLRKGGSAVATPLLSLLGFPGFVAVASPLPATVPSTLVASAEYWRSRLLDWEIVWWSIGIGTPAIVAGSFLSHSVGARPLLVVNRGSCVGFGLSFLFFPKDRSLAKEAFSDGFRHAVLPIENKQQLAPAHNRNWIVACRFGAGVWSSKMPLDYKNAYTNQMAAAGWHITTESIEPGHIKGEEACCGFIICAPLAFLAGRTPGYIVTTFAREYALCPHCGSHQPSRAAFCHDCGKALGSAPTTGK
jgi:Sulfite exporter TauE/SafE